MQSCAHNFCQNMKYISFANVSGIGNFSCTMTSFSMGLKGVLTLVCCHVDWAGQPSPVSWRHGGAGCWLHLDSQPQVSLPLLTAACKPSTAMLWALQHPGMLYTTVEFKLCSCAWALDNLPFHVTKLFRGIKNWFQNPHWGLLGWQGLTLEQPGFCHAWL